MLVKSNPEYDIKGIEEILKSNPELKEEHDLRVAEMKFKQSLIEARKKKSLSQQDVGELSGLSQQAVSRLERGTGGNINTLIKYLFSMGYTLDIEENH